MSRPNGLRHTMRPSIIPQTKSYPRGRMMHGMRSKGALPTGISIVEYDQITNVSPSDSRNMLVARAWQALRLPRSMFLGLIVLVVVMPGASGLAASNANTEAHNPPQTTTIPRTAPIESEPAPDGDFQGHTEWRIRAWFALTIVALLSFLVGRASVRHAPPRAAVDGAIRAVIVDQKRLGVAYHFQHLDPVLDEAQKAVLAALKKLDLV
jgi:hypothetical protein